MPILAKTSQNSAFTSKKSDSIGNIDKRENDDEVFPSSIMGDFIAIYN